MKEVGEARKKETYKQRKIFDFEQFLYIQSNERAYTVDCSEVSTKILI
jgi:hypothetical protein